MSKTIRIDDTNWRRLQALGTGFAGSERGTPDKVIEMLLDAYEDNHAPPDENGPVLGTCPHGVDLDREFCPKGCRV